jgi:hypothetical protein
MEEDYPNELLRSAAMNLSSLSSHALAILHNKRQDLPDQELEFLRLALAGRFTPLNQDEPLCRVYLKPLNQADPATICNRSYGDVVGTGSTMPFRLDMRFPPIPKSDIRIPTTNVAISVDLELEV